MRKLSYDKAVKKINSAEKGVPLLIRDANLSIVMYARNIYVTKNPEKFSFKVEENNKEYAWECDRGLDLDFDKGKRFVIEYEKGLLWKVPMMKVDWKVVDGVHVPNYSQAQKK